MIALGGVRGVLGDLLVTAAAWAGAGGASTYMCLVLTWFHERSYLQLSLQLLQVQVLSEGMLASTVLLAGLVLVCCCAAVWC